MPRPTNHSSVYALVSVLLFSLSCSSLSSLPSVPSFPPTPPHSTAPTGGSPLSADWNADTSFGSFAFTVAPDGSKITTAVIRMQGFRCGGTTLTTTTQTLDQWPIENDAFSSDVTLDSDQSLYLSFDGTYDDSTRTFSGTWSEDASGTQCSGDWETDPHNP